MSSTETGAIFGNLVYESTGYADRRRAPLPRRLPPRACGRREACWEGRGARGARQPRLAGSRAMPRLSTRRPSLCPRPTPPAPATPLPSPPRSVVVLADIHIDIMDYIVPASCPDAQFRAMWAEFEWENKVAVNTAIADPGAFLDHIIASTNMVRARERQGAGAGGAAGPGFRDGGGWRWCWWWQGAERAAVWERCAAHACVAAARPSRVLACTHALGPPCSRPSPPPRPPQRCLTPPSALDGECGFLAANLYARSVFGEDALVNVSVEQLPDGRLGGYIRIRSKTQGIALSLGDKLILRRGRAAGGAAAGAWVGRAGRGGACAPLRSAARAAARLRRLA